LALTVNNPGAVAVYTELSSEQLSAVARAFQLGELRLARGIPYGSINTNFRLETGTGTYFLRHSTVRSASDLEFEADLISHLTNGGFPAPTLVRGPAGAAFLDLAGGRASVFRYLAGEELTKAALLPEHCAQVGGELGKLHRIANSFGGARENPYSPAQVRQWLDELSAHRDPEIQPLASELGDLLRESQSFDRGLLPRGAIHADLFMDNVKWVGDRLSAFFDFEMACRDAFVLDLAIALNAWCFEGRYQEDLCRAIVRGYQAQRPISAIEKEALYSEALFGAVRYSASRIRDFHLSTLPEERLVRKDYRTYLARARALHQMRPAAFKTMVGL
jgi:homoserine kinase type II